MEPSSCTPTSDSASPAGARRAPLWLEWAIANSLPLVLVPLATRALRGRLGYETRAALAYPVSLGFIALVQGLTLALHVAWGMRWTFATAAGLVVACGSGALLVGTLDPLGYSEILVVCLAHAIGGAVVAASQTLVLRGSVERPWIWIAASAASAGVFAALLFPFWSDTRIPGYVSQTYAGSIEMTTLIRAFAAYGVATGPVLAWLLRGRIPLGQ